MNYDILTPIINEGSRLSSGICTGSTGDCIMTEEFYV